jgi:hypothetical protein
VVLLSDEPDLRSLFERALGGNESLVVAGGDEELRRALATPAATVAISVGVTDRIRSWQRVRELHHGMVLVAVDTADQTQGWPPDVARRFLVRPFGVEEIGAALAVHPRILREPAAARRRRLARAQGPPVIPPPLALPPPPAAEVEPVRRLETGESLWDTPAAPDEPAPAAAGEPAATGRGDPAPAKPLPAQPTPAKPGAKADVPSLAPPAGSERAATGTAERGEAGSTQSAAAAAAPSETARGTATTTRERARTNGTAPAPAAPPRQPEAAASPAARPERRRAGLLVTLVALLLVVTSAGGIAIGRATAPDQTGGSGTSAGTPATPSTAAPGVVIKEKAPAACDAALSDADAAISYLVGNVRDDRLTQSMQSYQQNRRACRAAR